jgi:PAS domain S-box-containing protein
MLHQKTDELRYLELRFSTAIDVMPVGAWLANPDGNIYYMNEANMELCGLEPGADMNTWRDQIHPEDKDRICELFDKSLTERVVAEFRFKSNDVEALDPNTTEHWVVASSGPARDDKGEIFMIYGTLMDISTRKANELYQIRRAEEAMETKRQQEYFIDMVSS